MKSTTARVVTLVVLVAAAAVLFVVLNGGDDDSDDSTTSTQTTATTAGKPAEPKFDVITMKDGAPVGGVQELEYTQGDQVRIEVRLDEPQEEVHLHGYDIEKPNPSGTVRFVFTADLEGIFELEAHGPDGDVPLADITVNPS